LRYPADTALAEQDTSLRLMHTLMSRPYE